VRSVDSAISTAVAAHVIKGIYLCRLDFDSGIVAWHSGFGNIVLNTVTYTGVGTLGNISVIKEETGVKAASVAVTLSGIKSEVVSLALSQPFLNRKAYVYFVPIDEEDQPVTANAYLLFRGAIDSIDGVTGSTAKFNVSLKSRLSDWSRPRKSLYSDVEQQQLYPGDKGMEYIAQLSQKKIIWPRAAFLPDPRD